MIKSMTGFGRGQGVGEGKVVTIEAKAVNHRYSEVMVRTPRQYVSFEDRIRKTVLGMISRGRVDLFVTVEAEATAEKAVKVDKALAMAYYNALKEISAIIETDRQVELEHILRLPEVIKLEETEENLELFWPIVEQAVQQAIAQLIEMRTVEGAKLKADILHRLDRIVQFNKQIATRAPLVVGEYRQRLQERIAELLDSSRYTVDEARLAMEVALFADRAAIDEELVRLESHVTQTITALASNEPVGRKLDFLVQEMNREINTIGSKANDLQIANYVVELKAEIEKIREQVQNIE